MLVRRAIARFVSGRGRMMSTGLLAVMAGGLLRLVGAKSNRTRRSTYRSVENCHRKDGHNDSRPLGISLHKHFKPITNCIWPWRMQLSDAATRLRFHLRDFDARAGRFVDTVILPDQRSSEERCKLNWSRMRNTVCSTRSSIVLGWL